MRMINKIFGMAALAAAYIAYPISSANCQQLDLKTPEQVVLENKVEEQIHPKPALDSLDTSDTSGISAITSEVDDSEAVHRFLNAEEQETVSSYLDKLINLPDNPKARTKGQNFVLKRTAASVLIESYALQLSQSADKKIIQSYVGDKDGNLILVKTELNTAGSVDYDDCVRAKNFLIDELERRYSQEDIEHLKKTNPGIRVLYE